MNKLIGLAGLMLIGLLGCASDEPVPPAPPRMADSEGCYNIGENPSPMLSCTPNCYYLSGSNRPYHGGPISTRCVQQCLSSGQLTPYCVEAPVEDAGVQDAAADSSDVATDVIDVTPIEDATPDTPPVDVQPARCESNADCDDHDPMTDDVCYSMTGVCHHTRTVIEAPPFDPVARQTLTSLCEQPVSCASGNEVRFGPQCDSSYATSTWDERGYPLYLYFDAVPASRVIHVTPRLWVGDPRDSFRVQTGMNYATSTVIDRVMTVAEIERGLDFAVTMPGSIFLTLQPSSFSLYSTALQWALPPGSVTDGMGRALSTCLQVGRFTPIPQHGFMQLQTGTDGRLECAGRVLRTDPVSGIMVGWAREESSSTLYYIHFPPAPARYVYSFATAREAIDWLSPQSRQTLCAVAMVFPDGTFSRLMGSSRVEVGVRPGVYVDWRDEMGNPHQGIAGYDFTIHETRWPTDTAYGCSSYSQFTPMRDPDHLCAIDVTPIVSRYTIVSAPMATGFMASAWRTVSRIETYHEMH